MPDQPQTTILLVDDDLAKRYTVAKILQRAAFLVREAGTGHDALRMVADKPDLIILDVKLPDISGFEVCRRIKNNPATAAIPVLHLSTTFVDLEDKVQGLEGGADGYLTDVLEPLELIATVKALLRARRAEDAANLSARQWQVTFDAISDGVILLDRRGKVIRVNRSFGRILENTQGDPVGRNLHELFGISEGREVSPFTKMTETGNRGSLELKRNGRWLQIAVDPLLADDGALSGALAIISDITSHRQMEEELRRHAEELTIADRRKDEFLAMLAHELRNPLAPIINSLEEIRFVGSGDPAIGPALETAGRQVLHMGRLLDDLLDVSRFTRGKIELRKTTLDLAKVVAHGIETARPWIAANQQQLSVSLPDHAIRLEGDSTRLVQVVGNLLNNAAKYTGRGGRIFLEVERDGTDVLIRVRDTGVGLSPDMLPRVFELFSQADHTLDRSQGGLGIGLTLVQRLVRMHGGEVSVSSAGLGKGSEFTVRLPVLVDEMPAAPEPGAANEKGRPKSCQRVLVVDDNKDSALSLARVLRLWGHDVSVAHDGPRVIKAVAESPFDLILLDIGLPGMNGYQIAEELRKRPEFSGTILIALTGYGQEEDHRRSREAGFDIHMVKPVNLNDLRDLLANPDSTFDRSSYP